LREGVGVQDRPGLGPHDPVQGELIPIFELSRLFDVDASSTKPSYRGRRLRKPRVVVEDDGQKTGIVIDELLGQQQIVIKTLGDYLKGAPGISGGAIMPDGCVGLILDVGGLVRLANS
jgi:two-component system chemotaxis sensor kinase CheA